MLGRAWLLARETVSGFVADGAMMSGAAIAYYAIFSLAPVLVIAVAVAGHVFGQDAARDAVAAQVRDVMGPQAAETVSDMLAAAGRRESGLVASAIGLATILVTATGTFGAVESALNAIWRAPAPDSALRSTLRTRVAGLCLVLATGLLLIASLVASAALAAVKHYLELLPHTGMLADAANLLASSLLLAVAVGALYRVLPNRVLAWRDVAVGAAATALLLMVGKVLIGLYVTEAGIASSYGAAGSVFVVLLWIYYSALIFLLGAEFTKSWTRHYGSDSARRAEARAAGPGG